MLEDQDEIYLKLLLSIAKEKLYQEVDHQFYLKDELKVLTSEHDLDGLTYKLEIDDLKIINLARKIFIDIYQVSYNYFGYIYGDEFEYSIVERIKSNIRYFIEKRFREHGLDVCYGNLF